MDKERLIAFLKRSSKEHAEDAERFGKDSIYRGFEKCNLYEKALNRGYSDAFALCARWLEEIQNE